MSTINPGYVMNPEEMLAYIESNIPGLNKENSQGIEKVVIKRATLPSKLSHGNQDHLGREKKLLEKGSNGLECTITVHFGEEREEHYRAHVKLYNQITGSDIQFEIQDGLATYDSLADDFILRLRNNLEEKPIVGIIFGSNYNFRNETASVQDPEFVEKLLQLYSKHKLSNPQAEQWSPDSLEAFGYSHLVTMSIARNLDQSREIAKNIIEDTNCENPQYSIMDFIAPEQVLFEDTKFSEMYALFANELTKLPDSINLYQDNGYHRQVILDFAFHSLKNQEFREDFEALLNESGSAYTMVQDEYQDYGIIEVEGGIILNIGWTSGSQGARITKRILENETPDFVLAYGSCGGISEDVNVGDIVYPSNVTYQGEEITFNNGFKPHETFSFGQRNISTHDGSMLNVQTPITETRNQLSGHTAVEMELYHILSAIKDSGQTPVFAAGYYVSDHPLKDHSLAIKKDISSGHYLVQKVLSAIK